MLSSLNNIVTSHMAVPDTDYTPLPNNDQFPSSIKLKGVAIVNDVIFLLINLFGRIGDVENLY